MNDVATFVGTVVLCSALAFFFGGALEQSDVGERLHDAKVVHQRDIVARQALYRTNEAQRALIELLIQKLRAR